MATITEKLIDDIEEASKEGFRGRLLARGQARAMIWRDGVLPSGAPAFAQNLSYDLLSYGYSLLEMGLRLRELDGNPESFRKAFEQAAGAIESVCSKGNPSDLKTGFYRITSAVAFHLARYSARSYVLLKSTLTDYDLTMSERALCLLVLRDLDQLQDELIQRRFEGSGDDTQLCSFLENARETSNDDIDVEVDDVIEAVDRALSDDYLGALATFLIAIETGNNAYVKFALDQIKIGLEISSQLNLVTQWWIHRLTHHLLDDLWESTLHVILPIKPTNGNNEKWRNLRELFIASLIRRHKAEIDLWPSQIEAARRAVDPTDNLVISLPTSAGKTRIAELCVLRCLAQDKRIVYLTPLRALSAQTENTLRQSFLPLGYTVTSLYGSIGDSGFDRSVFEERDIVVATPEKLDFALRSNPELIDDVGLIILDEGHMIGFGEREIRYEVQIQRLLRRDDAYQRRIVCLSAVLPHGEQLDDFVSWLRRDEEGSPIESSWRPTRLRYGEVVWSETYARLNLIVGNEQPFIPRFLRSLQPTSEMRRSFGVGIRRTPFPRDQRELVIATAWRLVKDGHSVLIYCPERRSVEPYAKAIADLYLRGLLESVIDSEGSEISAASALGIEWLGDKHPNVSCLKLGVAIHHGALPTAYRKEIEKLLRNGVLKITVSSPTLAQGLNLSATSIVMHDVCYFDGSIGSRQLMQPSQFQNIIGRAGRAFVDIEGLVLYPMYDDFDRRQNDWKRLVDTAYESELESGLLELVIALLERINRTLGNPPFEEVIEYVMNNSAAWDFQNYDLEDQQRSETEKRRWQQNIASLDTALLSLLGEDDFNTDEIADKIDEVLNSSFLQRRIIHHDDSIQSAFHIVLNSRTKYIWERSSTSQRRGYFLAGVGLESGRKLDVISEDLNRLLVRANQSIIDNETDEALKSISELAAILFSIEPFVPEPIPENWQSILEIWLRGLNISDELGEVSTEALQFIEGGLSFRLTWGMEAVRVRAVANLDTVDLPEGEFVFDESWRNSAVSAVECGTLNTSAAVLIQAGFSSRLAAIKVVENTEAVFSNSSELSAWLQTSEVVELMKEPNWPTAESKELWRDFITGFKPASEAIWKKQQGTCTVNWTQETSVPRTGMNVRLYRSEDGQTLVLTPALKTIGKLESDLEDKPTGLINVEVSNRKNELDLTYFGPNDLRFISTF